jgi:hypothetical protein
LSCWDVLPAAGGGTSPTLLALFSTGDLTLVNMPVSRGAGAGAGAVDGRLGPSVPFVHAAADDSDDDRSVASLGQHHMAAPGACSLLQCPPPAPTTDALTTRPSTGAIAHFLARCSAVFGVEQPAPGEIASACAALTSAAPVTSDAGGCGCAVPPEVAGTLDRCRVCHPQAATGHVCDRPDVRGEWMCGCVLVCARWGGWQCECPSVHGITHALAVCVFCV